MTPAEKITGISDREARARTLAEEVGRWLLHDSAVERKLSELVKLAGATDPAAKQLAMSVNTCVAMAERLLDGDHDRQLILEGLIRNLTDLTNFYLGGGAMIRITFINGSVITTDRINHQEITTAITNAKEFPFLSWVDEFGKKRTIVLRHVMSVEER